jgi:hypothetical protein
MKKEFVYLNLNRLNLNALAHVKKLKPLYAPWVDPNFMKFSKNREP